MSRESATALPGASDLVLVAVMPTPRDMEIARLLGWYRIPLRSSPKVIPVDYVAFYQPGAFGDRRWRVEVVAPLLGHELRTRIELLRDEPDHPHAHEEYFKLQLGPLAALPQPILAERWKRLTFLYTTGKYLLRARSLRELVVAPEERQFVWRVLRDRALAGSSYPAGERSWMELDAAAIAGWLGWNPPG